MRIVAGKHRGRRLKAPAGGGVRPTADRVREALFNVLAHNASGTGGAAPPQDVHVVDVFAGTGALGLEALSRGAEHVVFIENHPQVLQVLRRNVEALGATSSVTLLPRDATRPGRAKAPCALAFLDPPYRSRLAAPALEALARGGWLADGALCVVELAAKEAFEAPPGFEGVDERRYGATRVVFLRWTP